ACTLRGARAGVTATAALAFGMLAKEWAVTGVAVVPILAYACRRGGGARHGEAVRHAALVAAPCAVLLAAYLACRTRTTGGLLGGYSGERLDPLDPAYWWSRARFVAGVLVPVPWSRHGPSLLAAWVALSAAAAASLAHTRPRAALALLAVLG